ncbi:MAG: S1C family serine protease [Dehalococcoidia bacterium]
MFGKISRLMVVLLLLGLLAAACSPGASDSTGSGSPATNQSVAAAPGAGSTVQVVKTLTPSVVHIATQSLALDQFNRPVPSGGVGTGLILDPEGNILTNNHVIAGARRIVVTLSSGESFPARLVGGDPSTDTAIINIDADNLQPATLGDSDLLQVGEEVIATGHALGLPGGPTVSKGVVSALGRSIDSDPHTTMVDLIQTDAAINPGNSGGPLANRRGEVIGMNSAIIQGSQGIGFAISINEAMNVAEQLMAHGFVNRGFLGISPVNLAPALANQLGIPPVAGVLITQVIPNSAAELQGLRGQDVIVQLDDVSITNTGELSKFLIDHPPGSTVNVGFLRGGQGLSLELTLGERPNR